MLERFTGKTALITGGSSGIGRAAALMLAVDGADVIITGRDESRLKETLVLIEERGRSADYYICDLSSPDNIDEVVHEILEKADGIDFLVNCAGTPLLKKFSETTPQEWNYVFGVNCTSVFLLSRFIVRDMIEKKVPGKIVSVASTVGKSPQAYASAYSVSKAALIALTRSLSRELASYGITVNAVCPGAVNTPMLNSYTIPELAKFFKSSEEDVLKRIRGGNPLKKIAEPAEIAELIGFLLSPSADDITGQAINMDGGVEYF